ncbi:MAG: ribosome biogenesis GTP-binding protein YihA/YsxC [Bacilli bacterium]
MKIKSSDFVASIASSDNYIETDKSEILLLGRSNVGKSSFINMILNRKKIAYTSGKPGKTQTLNFFFVNEEFYLVDAPGYGFAKVNKKVREKFGQMIEEYLTLRKNLKLVMLLVDLRHNPTNDDIMMYEFLTYYDIPTVVIATKSDKLSNNKINSAVKNLRKYFVCDIIPVSSVNGDGKDNIYKKIQEYI